MQDYTLEWLFLIGLVLLVAIWAWSVWRGVPPRQEKPDAQVSSGPTLMDYYRKRAEVADSRRADARGAAWARAEAQERADARAGEGIQEKADKEARRTAWRQADTQARRRAQAEAVVRKKAQAKADDRAAQHAEAQRKARAAAKEREPVCARARVRARAQMRAGEGEIGFSALHKNSPINLLGYRVGASSPLLPRERRAILASAVSDHLPNAFGPDYLAIWGTPGTRKRYEQIQRHLRFLLKSQGAHPRRRLAANDWTADLEWLTAQFGARFTH